jgi:hypothetical protein
MKEYIFPGLLLLILLSSCRDQPPAPSRIIINGHTYVIDTLREDSIRPGDVIENFALSGDFQNYLKNKPAAPFSNLCGSVPKNMKALDGGLRKYFYKVTGKDNMDLSLFGYAGAKLGRKEVLVIVDFVQYKEIQCKDKTRTFGVGARLFLHILEIKHGINFTKLPQLAANVELGRASVTYTVSTIGLTGDKVLDILPQGSDFNVENYAMVMNSIDRIIRLAKDNTPGVVIAPQLLPQITVSAE